MGTLPTLGTSHHVPTQLSTHKYPRKVLSKGQTLLGLDSAVGGTAFTIDTTPAFGSMCKSKVFVSLKGICFPYLARLLQSTIQRLTAVMDAALVNMGSWGSYAAATLTGCQGTYSSFDSQENDREATCRLVLHSLTLGNLPGCNTLLWERDFSLLSVTNYGACESR